MFSKPEQIAGHLLTIIGASLVGYGTESWCVGIGLYILFAINHETVEVSFERFLKKSENYNKE